MFNPDAHREAIGRTEDVVDRVATDKDMSPDEREAFGALWGTWLGLTFTLIAYGIPQRSLCESAARVVEVREEFGQRTERATT